MTTKAASQKAEQEYGDPIPAAEPVSRAVLEDRWAQLMVAPKEFTDGWSLDNSPEYYKLERWLRRNVRHIAHYEFDDAGLDKIVESVQATVRGEVLRLVDEARIAS